MKRIQPLHVCGVVIGEPNLETVSEEDIAAWMAYDEIMSGESPEMPFDVPRYGVRHPSADLALRLFVARDPDGSIAGDGQAVVSRAPDDRQICQAHVSVRPDRRRRGIGSRLLHLIVEAAESEGRTLLTGWCAEGVSDGVRFARSIGAEPVLRHYENRLVLATLDRQQLRTWLAQGRARAAEYTLVSADGPYRDDTIDAIVKLRQTIDMVSGGGGLRMGPAPVTAEQIREGDAKGIGERRWTLCARHSPTGELAGITEVWFPPKEPRVLKQLSTAVQPSHRGRGLGKWLKAAMLERVIAERPEIEEVRTGNFASNAPMLAINRELGFEPLLTATAWQVPIARVREHLDHIHWAT